MEQAMYDLKQIQGKPMIAILSKSGSVISPSDNMILTVLHAVTPVSEIWPRPQSNLETN